MKRLAALLLAAAAAPAAAVGLGPLAKQGITDGDGKAFYLTLMNPYDRPAEFFAYPVGLEDEARQERVAIVPDRVRLGSKQNRSLLIIARGLAPGETYQFRVCAEREMPEQGTVHARVCSKLSARRIAAR